jgi:hypothetical protein
MSGGFDRHLKKGNTMSIRRVVPDITSNRIDESRKFYTEFLGFDVAMDMGALSRSHRQAIRQLRSRSCERPDRRHHARI